MLTELKAVLKKPMLWITMVGVALVPALYNIIFLSSMWDPYGKVSDLPVAVVNKDKTTTYEGKKMTIGKDMTDNMVHNKSLDYHFVDSEKAQKGLEKGDYYMIITLPEDLSQNAASVLTDEPKKLTIPYQTSKGHSFVASKMSETAAKTLKESVSKNITSSYTKSLFKSMSTLKTGLGSAANASQKIATGSKQLANGSQVMTDNLNLLSNSSQTFAQGTNTLYSGLTAYTGGVGQLSAGLNNLNNGLTAYTNGVGQLANGSSQLSNQSQKLLGGVAQLANGSTSIQQLVNASSQLNQGLIKLSTATGLSEEQVQQFSSLINQLGTLNQSIQNYSDNGTATTANSPDLSTYLSAITTAAQAIVNSGNTSQQTTTNQSNALAAVQTTGAYQRLSAEDQSEIAAALANTDSSTTTTGADANAVSQAQAILNNVQSIQSALSTVQTTTANTPTSPSASLTQIKNTANSVLPSAATSLTTLSSGSGELSKALSTAKNKLSLVAVDNDNAKTLSSPVTIKHTDKDNVKTNGVGMAPYMMSAALMVMAISTNTIFRAALSGKQAKTLREWIEQKLAVNGLIAVTGAIILYFGVHIIGLSANFELKTLGLIILTSITFMVLVTTLVTWHDKFGSFAALILLLLQLGSSAGTYPLAVTDKFFQVVNPYLPMSYSVSGLRETISMAGTIGNQLLALSLFFLTFAALGLLIARRRIRSVKVA